GKSKFTKTKMWHFAFDAIIAFSFLPLRLASYLGLIIIFFDGAVILATIVRWLLGFGQWLSGPATILVAVLFIGGIELVCLGIVGEYIARIYDEIKRRPLY